MSAAWLASLAAFAPSSAAVAQTSARAPGALKGFYFQHKDWELACDNTGTCRAAGYPPESSTGVPASVQIARAAGAAASIGIIFKAQTLATNQGDSDAKGRFSLRIGKAAVADFAFNQELSAIQSAELLPALLEGQQVELVQGKTSWPISLAGLAAVALKMDDRQKRVGTVGALAAGARGSKDESAVPGPQAAPKIAVPQLPITAAVPAPASQALANALLKAIGKTDCSAQRPEVTVHALNATQLLVQLDPCDAAVYNSTSAYYLANAKPPHAPKRIVLDGPAQQFHAGIISGAEKGRGLADCATFARFAWNGQRFVKAGSSGSQMCRGFVGGAWELPTFVSQVSNPNVKPSKN